MEKFNIITLGIAIVCLIFIFVVPFIIHSIRKKVGPYDYPWLLHIFPINCLMLLIIDVIVFIITHALKYIIR